jgi:hypothetical protein
MNNVLFLTICKQFTYVLAMAGLIGIASAFFAQFSPVAAVAAADAKKELVEPKIITPGTLGTDSTASTPPSDAVVIFNGKDMSGFTGGGGKAPAWLIEDGVLQIVKGSGSAITKEQISDAQIHVEWASPVGDTGKGQQRGNSGLYIQDRFEAQIMDSYENATNPDQQAASLYKNFPPLFNVCRPQGKFQNYDVIFHGPKLNGKEVIRPATITLIHNGVVVQYNRPLAHGTGAKTRAPLVEKGPILVQNHTDEVRFRSFWIRHLKPRRDTEFNGGKVDKKKEVPLLDAGGWASTGKPPADAVVLFAGKDTSAWNQKDGKFPWKVEDGYMEVTRGGGSIRTKEQFGSVQLHVEWATPKEVKGNSQGRGNSGVYIGRWETQVLDSYNNKTYFDGQAGSLYKRYPPLVNACRKPGEWQTYDIIFHAPKYDADGKLARPGSFTTLHNGVLIQDHSVLKDSPKTGPKNGYIMGNIQLQDHGNPVRYRNVWLRKLEE